MLDLQKERPQFLGLVGNPMVIPCRRRIGRQRDNIGLVDGRIEFGIVRQQIPVEHIGQQHDAVQVDVLVLQRQRQPGGAHGAVAFAEDVFGRIPAIVLAEKLLNERGEGVDILIDAVEILVRVLAADPAKPGAGHVDEHDVADIEQTLVVVHDGIRRGRRVAVVIGEHAARAERAHVQPYRRGPWAAVEQERDRPPGHIRAVLEIGDVGHAGFGGRVLVVVPGGRGVVPALGMDDQRAGEGVVGDRGAAGGDAAAGFVFGGLEIRRSVVGLFGIVGVGGDHAGRERGGDEKSALHERRCPVWRREPIQRVWVWEPYRARRAGQHRHIISHNIDYTKF